MSKPCAIHAVISFTPASCAGARIITAWPDSFPSVITGYQVHSKSDTALMVRYSSSSQQPYPFAKDVTTNNPYAGAFSFGSRVPRVP